MKEKIVSNLASLTEELTASSVVELNDAEISKVAGGLYLAEEMLDSK
jgi:hypothetical protein